MMGFRLSRTLLYRADIAIGLGAYSIVLKLYTYKVILESAQKVGIFLREFFVISFLQITFI